MENFVFIISVFYGIIFVMILIFFYCLDFNIKIKINNNFFKVFWCENYDIFM